LNRKPQGEYLKALITFLDEFTPDTHYQSPLASG